MNQDFKKALWDTANALRGAVDASDYKYPVLGLIFLKYISDAFHARRAAIEAAVSDPSSDDYRAKPAHRAAALNDKTEYTKDHVLWMPDAARWQFLQDNSRQVDIAVKLDAAMSDVEAANSTLAGRLPKVYVGSGLDVSIIGRLIDEVSKIVFDDKDGGDVIGDVYEYFLGNFAGSEGKRAGEFYTTKSIVNVLVAVLAPKRGKLYDPACGAGGMFVSSKKYLLAHKGSASDFSVYGQEYNPNTWRLAAMNLAIRGMEFNLGATNGDTFSANQHPDLKADYIFMNPPFGANSAWPRDALSEDPRWVYGIPPEKPAHFAWLQHALHHLADQGQAGIVMPNGTLTTQSGGEGAIRQKMVEADVVECIISLPGQLFHNTSIPCCLWFFAKDKTANGRARKGEVLFIDARKMGFLKDRVHREFTEEDVQQIEQTVHLWREDVDRLPAADGEVAPVYQDIPGFCKVATLADIAAQGFVLSPGRYTGSEEVEEDDEAFKEKLDSLVSDLQGLFGKGDALRVEVRAGLKGLGYDL